jgi:hypothetical protein
LKVSPSVNLLVRSPFRSHQMGKFLFTLHGNVWNDYASGGISGWLGAIHF